MRIVWDENKNEKLKETRGVSFEEVYDAILKDEILDIIEVPAIQRKGQRCFVLRLNGYVHYVPYDIDMEECVLKTIIPSRELNRKYSNE